MLQEKERFVIISPFFSVIRSTFFYGQGIYFIFPMVDELYIQFVVSVSSLEKLLKTR